MLLSTIIMLLSTINLAICSKPPPSSTPTPTGPSKSSHPSPLDLPWSTFGFSLNGVHTPLMYLQVINATDAHNTFDGSGGGSGKLRSGWLEGGGIVEHKGITLPPSSTVLNYGQGLFEGIKAFRRKNGEVRLDKERSDELTATIMAMKTVRR